MFLKWWVPTGNLTVPGTPCAGDLSEPRDRYSSNKKEVATLPLFLQLKSGWINFDNYPAMRNCHP